MKLDIVITELFVGGAERCAVQLALHLKQQNHSVRVISLGASPIGDSAILIRQLEQANIPTHFLDGTGPWHLLRTYRRLKRLVVTDPPELAQAFLFHANVLAAMVYPQLKDRSIPLVGGSRVAETRRTRHPFSRWAAKRMSKIVCVSESVRRWAIQTEGMDREKLLVISNGVETSESNDGVPWEDFGIPEQARKLLFVGRLEPQKGIDKLVALAEQFLPMEDWHLVIVGEGPLGQTLRHKALESTFSRRFHFVGWQANPRAWMRSSDLLLLPARYEGMPNVVLEAMAEGRCVVATDVEGVRECLGPNAADQIVGRNDWNGFAARVWKLMEGDVRRQELGRLNRAYCQENHNLYRKLDEYESLYRTLLARKV